VEAQLAHLHSLRVPVSEMTHTAIEAKAEIVFTGAGGLTVGDWVEVTHDFSPGHSSGGGVGVITEVVATMCHVKYIVDGHVEKFIPITRMTMIPMPYRREKAQLRTRSVRTTTDTTTGFSSTAFHISLPSSTRKKKHNTSITYLHV
jgi:hypothetical protein